MACDVRDVPSWVYDGWFANNQQAQHMPMIHYATTEHTTPAERAASAAFVLAPSFPCTSCGRFSFPTLMDCFWCRRGRVCA